eukprot:8133175-Pyramimonas_sp.AAC.1
MHHMIFPEELPRAMIRGTLHLVVFEVHNLYIFQRSETCLSLTHASPRSGRRGTADARASDKFHGRQ